MRLDLGEVDWDYVTQLTAEADTGVAWGAGRTNVNYSLSYGK